MSIEKSNIPTHTGTRRLADLRKARYESLLIAVLMVSLVAAGALILWG